jgi:hypothetical protein
MGLRCVRVVWRVCDALFTHLLACYSQAVRREVRALARVRHPNVVRLYPQAG